MVFKFHNLGMIGSAEIEVKGLTVITGLNDTGKSFLSKGIYSLIKTVQEAKEYEFANRIDAVDQALRPLMLLFRQSPVQAASFDVFRSELITSFIQKVPESGLITMVDKKRSEILNEASQLLIFDITNEQINKAFEDLKKAIVLKINDEENYKRYFDKTVIQQLFRSKMNNLSHDSMLTIECMDNNLSVLNVEIVDNKTKSFKMTSPFTYLDATLIDSPIILQLAYFIRQQRVRPTSLLRRGQEGLPSYYLDLLAKLPSISLNNTFSEITSQIQNVIGGKLIYEEKGDAFVYQKENGQKIDAYNTATGVKSFGIIQLLLNSGILNSKSVLIIDEPEVHLHPKWEIQYAEIIVSLSKMGIPIIISSHSPYLLEALTVFIKKHETQTISKFYFGEKDVKSNLSIFKDVTEDLEPIFARLSEPMQDLFLNN